MSLLLTLLALAASDPPAKGPADLQGCWKLVSVEADGKPADPLGGGQPRWVVKGDAVSYGGAELARLTADPAASPRALDLKFVSPDRVYEGVYAVEKDTLRVCLNGRADAKDRPDALKTEGHADRRLLVFEREKSPPADPLDGLTGYVGVQLRGADGAVTIDAPLKDSPADKAGAKKGDVVLAIGGAAATDLPAAVKTVRAAKPGSKLAVRVKRGDKEVELSVAVGVLPFHWVAGLE
jgi:uncharacterized protein (TIGR03067 family)